MKKLLLFIFILFGFVGFSQEYDEIYARDSVYIRDTSVTNLIKQHGGSTTFTGLTDTESSYTPYEFQIANAAGTALESPTGLNYYGDSLVADSSIIAGKSIGIGTSNPLAALHINKGTGAGTGIAFSDGSEQIYIVGADHIRFGLSTSLWDFTESQFNWANGLGWSLLNELPTLTNPVIVPNRGDPNTGVSWNVDDEGVLIAGGKAIASFKEDVTEQFIINPQGDLTGTLAAPNLAFTNSDLTTDVGLFLISDNNLAITVNSIEAMRLTEDTVFVDSTLRIGNNLIIDSKTDTNALIISRTTGFASIKGTGLLIIDSDGAEDLRLNNYNIGDVILVNGGGNVGIGDESPSFKLDVNGTGRFTGDLTVDGTLIQSIGTIADNDETPDVSGGNVWVYNGTANFMVITDLDNPTAGAIYYIVGNSDTFSISINNGGNFSLEGNWTGGDNDTITLLCLADNNYIEISRSSN